MRAAIIEAFGRGPRYSEFKDPVAADGEVIINVAAAGLHPIVRALAHGTHYGSTGALPFVPGVDGVGRLDNGTRVFFGVSRSPYGSFADRSVTARAMCVPLPDALDDAVAAALANPAMSSWVALKFRAGLIAGEDVLILGATGIAGKLAVQVAKRLGANRVIAVGRNRQSIEDLRGLGADAVVPLEPDPADSVGALRAEWAKAPVSIVLDYLWGRPAELFFEAITQRGVQHAANRVRYVQIGSSAGATANVPASALRSTGLELLGSGFGSASIDRILRAVQELFQEAARQPFHCEIRTAPLYEIESRWKEDGQRARLVFQAG